MKPSIARRLIRLRNLVGFPLTWPLRLVRAACSFTVQQKETRDHA